jgi:hypothetical protein
MCPYCHYVIQDDFSWKAVFAEVICLFTNAKHFTQSPSILPHPQQSGSAQAGGSYFEPPSQRKEPQATPLGQLLFADAVLTTRKVYKCYLDHVIQAFDYYCPRFNLPSNPW